MLIQQGDVLIEKTKEVQGEKLDHTVLAEGEATGHFHRAKPCTKEDIVELFEQDKQLYLRVKGNAVVTHEEHKPVTIPTGDYIVRKVREWDYWKEEAREVAD